MQINKERSRKITKLISLTLATNMLLSGGITAKAENDSEFDENVRKQIEFHAAQRELEIMIANLSEELYDKEYNDFCDNGSITVNGIEYKIEYLHIEYGYIGNQKTVYLKDFYNPRFDIITEKMIDDNYERTKIMSLKYSDVFYAYYRNKDLSLEEYINLFEGNINYNVPETYFYNPIFNSKKEKVK